VRDDVRHGRHDHGNVVGCAASSLLCGDPEVNNIRDITTDAARAQCLGRIGDRDARALGTLVVGASSPHRRGMLAQGPRLAVGLTQWGSSARGLPFASSHWTRSDRDGPRADPRADRHGEAARGDGLGC
jgi:hypothetical protein